ncbi:preprotein translocase subunit SecA, partial [bacterium]|nr:preprotein translocase subunit SecA [bacterium]
MFNWAKKIFVDTNERELKKLQPIVEKINSYEPNVSKLNDEKLKDKTTEFKERLGKGEIVDEILPEVFAVVREVAKRVTGMKPFNVQLVGGIILHQGKIAEMATGEGKTLVATMPAYLNALKGNSVHVVTVNDYLAKRDRYWMGEIYEFLGLEVGLIQHDMAIGERKKAYEADITYGTNNEFGFDYLRDNMAIRLEDVVQRGYDFAIVDEVDSILIDEARTPLIISGPTDESTKIYQQVNRIATRLQEEI